MGGLLNLQRPFEPSERSLQPAVRRENTTVHFQHQLAGHGRQLLPHTAQTLKETLDAPPLRARHSSQVRHAPGSLAHLFGRAAASVAIASRNQKLRMHGGLLMMQRTLAKALRIERLVVSVNHSICATTSAPPSGPRQRKLECGNLFTTLHASFVVKKPRTPKPESN